jgi:hypothetical protein
MNRVPGWASAISVPTALLGVVVFFLPWLQFSCRQLAFTVSVFGYNSPPEVGSKDLTQTAPMSSGVEWNRNDGSAQLQEELDVPRNNPLNHRNYTRGGIPRGA